MARVKMTISISEDLKAWMNKQCEQYGMNYSSMIAMALAQYKSNMEAINGMNNMMQLKGMLEEVKNKA